MMCYDDSQMGFFFWPVPLFRTLELYVFNYLMVSPFLCRMHISNITCPKWCPGPSPSNPDLLIFHNHPVLQLGTSRFSLLPFSPSPSTSSSLTSPMKPSSTLYLDPSFAFSVPYYPYLFSRQSSALT